MDARRTVVVLHGAADLAVLEALARLALAARRCGGRCEVLLADDLLELTGLADALGRQPVGEPEAREERCGVEEVVQVDDPPP